MCKVPVKLRELVKQRLAAAAEEIFELLERTITEYEEELICKYDQQRKLETAERGPLSVGRSEWGPEPILIKEEQEWKVVSVKSEEEEAPETWTQPVHHNQTVDCPEPPVPVAASGDHLLHLNNRSVHKKTNKHQRKTQNRVKNHVCQNCSKAFPSKSALKRHIIVHTGEKPFSCSDCGKRFSLKSNMNKHRVIHSGLRPYTCSVCGKTFYRKAHLNSHLLVHIKLSAVQSVGNSNETEIQSESAHVHALV